MEASALNADYVKVCSWTFFLCERISLFIMRLLQFKELDGVYKLKSVSCL